MTSSAARGRPGRALFRAAEVCALAGVPPRTLRSWERAAPELEAASSDGVRMYRRADVQRVLAMARLIRDDGLTPAAAWRTLRAADAPADAPLPHPPHPSHQTDGGARLQGAAGRDARRRIVEVRQALRAIRDRLAAPPGGRRGAAAAPARRGGRRGGG